MPTTVVSSRFSDALEKHMNDKKISIRDLSSLVGITYEHARRITKGLAFPSPRLFKDVCEALKVKPGEWEKLLVADQMETKFGGVTATLAGKNPAFVPFEKVLYKLTEEQRKAFLMQMNAVAAQNR